MAYPTAHYSNIFFNFWKPSANSQVTNILYNTFHFFYKEIYACVIMAVHPSVHALSVSVSC